MYNEVILARSHGQHSIQDMRQSRSFSTYTFPTGLRLFATHPIGTRYLRDLTRDELMLLQDVIDTDIEDDLCDLNVVEEMQETIDRIDYVLARDMRDAPVPLLIPYAVHTPVFVEHGGRDSAREDRGGGSGGRRGRGYGDDDDADSYYYSDESRGGRRGAGRHDRRDDRRGRGHGDDRDSRHGGDRGHGHSHDRDHDSRHGGRRHRSPSYSDGDFNAPAADSRTAIHNLDFDPDEVASTVRRGGGASRVGASRAGASRTITQASSQGHGHGHSSSKEKSSTSKSHAAASKKKVSSGKASDSKKEKPKELFDKSGKRKK